MTIEGRATLSLGIVAFLGVTVFVLLGLLSIENQPLEGYHQTTNAKCHILNGLPDPACTPGQTLAGATKDKICVSGYSGTVRNVPEAEKTLVRGEYGMVDTCKPRGSCEVDHLISLELGGSNDSSNLWPQPNPDFHVKDSLENLLHKLVCNGTITLLEAQTAIASDWKAAEAKYGADLGSE